MALAFLSFLAGVITVTAPCIVTLLPVIIGGSIVRAGHQAEQRWVRPVTIAASLAVSVILFTLLLRATTAFLGIPQQVWAALSGLIVALFGLSLLWPALWDRVVINTGFGRQSGTALSVTARRRGIWGDIALGASLGPVFNSCSPTYLLVVATILPVSFAEGLAYIGAYALGLAMALLLLAYTGHSLIVRLGWLSNPHGAFRRIIGALLLIVGIIVIFGLDRTFQIFILDSGLYDPILEFEQRFNL